MNTLPPPPDPLLLPVRDPRARDLVLDYAEMHALVADLVLPGGASMYVMSALVTSRELIRHSSYRYEFATVAVTHSLFALEHVLAERLATNEPLHVLIERATDAGLITARGQTIKHKLSQVSVEQFGDVRGVSVSLAATPRTGDRPSGIEVGKKGRLSGRLLRSSVRAPISGAQRGGLMRYGLRAAFGAAVLLFTGLTGCSGDGGGSAAPASSGASPSAVVPSPSSSDLTEVINRTRSALMKSGAVGVDSPGDQGLMLVEAWPTGAAYTWETRDRRLCWASASEAGSSERACTSAPLTVGASKSVEPLATLFTDGWVRLFAADHQVVRSATCSGAPLEVRRVGAVSDGAQTLYSVWFPDYTKGSIALSLSHDGTSSEAPLLLGDLGDRSCDTTSQTPHPAGPGS